MSAKRSVNPKREERRKELSRIWHASMNAEGILDKDQVRSAYTAYLYHTPDLLEVEELARAEVDALDRELTEPEKTIGQMTFFDPHRFLALGEGERVLMDLASEEHLDRWFLVQTKAAAATANKHHEKTTYYVSRKSVFKKRKNLGAVEREEFDYVDP
jgi:hypothetical protein